MPDNADHADHADAATVRLPVIPRAPGVHGGSGVHGVHGVHNGPGVPAPRPPDDEPATGPIRVVGTAHPAPRATPPVAGGVPGAATARLVAAGATAAVALCAIVDALLWPIEYVSSGAAAPLLVLMLLPLLVAGTAGWAVRGLLVRDRRAPVVVHALTAGILFGAIVGTDGNGPGVLPLLVTVVASVAAWLSTADTRPGGGTAEPPPLGAAVLLAGWGAAGCAAAVVVGVVHAAVGAVYSSSSAGYVVAALLWLGAGATLLGARLRPAHRTVRIVTAAGAGATTIAAIADGGAGWTFVLAGLHASVAVLLLASTAVRRHLGEPPLAAVEAGTAAVRRLLENRGRAGTATTAGVPSWVRAVPVLVWLAAAAGAVLFVIGVGTYSGHSDEADSCTVASAGRFSLVRDTPECDSAFDAVRTGQALMAAGGAVAIGVPGRALLSTRRTRPST